MATIDGGTSAGVFSDWKQDAFPLFGKTGTAERYGHGDQSWYVAFVKHRSRPIVIATTVEDGGFGAEAAAPVTCRMLAEWYHQKARCTAAVVKE
jgi:penicillin-binding protein 2